MNQISVQSDYWPDIHGGSIMCKICEAEHEGMIEYHKWINEVMKDPPRPEPGEPDEHQNGRMNNA